MKKQPPITKILAEPESKRILDDLRNESDRGAVLIAGAYIDDLLRAILAHAMIDDEQLVKPLLNGPLSAFATRLKLARAFGLIGPDMSHDIEVLREVRNHFAHARKSLDLNDPEVANTCNRFIANKVVPDIPLDKFSIQRTRFTMVYIWITSHLLTCLDETGHADVVRDYFEGD